MAIKAVVFDLYQTLIYCQQQNHAHRQLFDQLGLNDAERIEARRLTRAENFESLKALAARVKPEGTADFETLGRALGAELASAICYPETIGVLRRLRKQGLRLGMISNLGTAYKQPVFNLGLDQYLEAMIFSCDIGLIKPDPLIYQAMIKSLDLNPWEIFMTGDLFAKDVQAPRYAGMRAVHLDRVNFSAGSIPSLEGIFQYL